MSQSDPVVIQFVRLLEQADKAPAGREIIEKCLHVASVLVEKNLAYGDSALNPTRVFSQASATEQLLVRMDDKLSRIKQRGVASDPEEDTVVDLAGYLVLLMISRERYA